MKEATLSGTNLELKKLEELLENNLVPICSGGECDRRHTCKYTVTYVLTRKRIRPVKSGELCGYYRE